MKTSHFLRWAAAAVVALLVTANAADQPTQTQSSTPDGVIVVSDDAVFAVRGGLARRVDATLVPPGQMLTNDGQLAPIPENVSGLGATGAARAIAGANTSASPGRPADETAATSQTGLVMQGGAIYMIRAGKATRLGTKSVPGGQMMTFDGELVRAPEGIQGLNEGVGVSGGGKASAKP
ncbi:MAG TPA: hypothetical protein VD994_14475 [Prosthecobacter sp.]|nr:hypothetical protein [Prosthecobacter sp.]